MTNEGADVITRDKNGRVSFGRLEFAIQALILLSLLAFALETLPSLSPGWRRFFEVLEAVTVALFTVEYLTRLALARPRTAYALSFFGIVDLLAILPFYLSTSIISSEMRSPRSTAPFFNRCGGP